MFRRFFILILSLCCAACTFGQSNSLVVFSASGKRFILTLNNEKVNAIPQSNIKAYDIGAGRQYLLVEFREDNDQSVLSDSIMISREDKYLDKEFTYSLTDETKNGKPAHALHFVTVNDTSGPRVPKVPEAPKEKVPLIDNNTYGILYTAKENKPLFFDNYNDSTRSCETPLGSRELTYLANLMSKTNDLETRYNEVMQTINKNCYSTVQLRELVSLLNIELDKLKACKDGYWHLTDRQNARTLVDVLGYKTLKEDFLNYLDELATVEKQQQLRCVTPVTDAKLKEMLTAIQSANYENDKVKIGRKQVANNCLSTGQLSQIVSLFTHDREKLEFLKLFYRSVTDKDNFYKLSDVFLFPETKEDFNKYYSK